MDLFLQLFTDYTLRTVTLGAAVLGAVAGSLGTFAVLREQGLLGDAISHAALPGIALAFLLTGSKAPLVLMAGAALAGWLATLFMMSVVETTRIKFDTVLGLTLSVFFGFGLVLLTFIQKRPDANQAGLETFLFGQAAALVQRDVVTMLVLGAAAVVVLAFCWRGFKLLSFDPDFGRSLGLPMRAFDIVLTGLLVVAIVMGLQTVGVVLMSAMLIAPAAASRQWTDRLVVMVVLAAVFGAASGAVGAALSASIANLPTGPTIVLCAGVVVVGSLLFGRARGLVWRWARTRRSSRRLRQDAVLLDLYALAAQHDEADHAHHERVLDLMAYEDARTSRALAQLESMGLVARTEPRAWSLTERGVERARRLAEERS